MMLSTREIELLTEKAENLTWHKNAFNCQKCPKEGCPAWMDIKWTLTNLETKVTAEKNLVGCSFVLQPILFADVVETTYKNIDNTREETKKVENLTQNLKLGFSAVMRAQLNLITKHEESLNREEKLLTQKSVNLLPKE